MGSKSNPSLLEKVFSGDTLPTCPKCGSDKFVSRLCAITVMAKSVEVFTCANGASACLRRCRFGNAESGATSFGLLPDGSKVIGIDGLRQTTGVDQYDKRWYKDVPFTQDEHLANIESKVRSILEVGVVKSSLRFCHTRICANFGKQTRGEFCGRCGAASKENGLSIGFLDGVSKRSCLNEACRVYGIHRESDTLDQFCKRCGTQFPHDIAKLAKGGVS